MGDDLCGRSFRDIGADFLVCSDISVDGVNARVAEQDAAYENRNTKEFSRQAVRDGIQQVCRRT